MGFRGYGAVLLAGRPDQYVTHSIAAPLRTHYRRGTCAEYECREYLEGWVTVVPTDSLQADYIRSDRTRGHRETRTAEGLARFEFEPGTVPFASPRHEHYVPVGRPPLYLVRHGTPGAYVRGAQVRQHSGPDAWINDAREHMGRVWKERE